jgi:hypothetical protein
MTLQEWEAQSPVAVSRLAAYPDARIVPYGTLPDALYRALWGLSDYIVSSVSGGAVWLVQR